MASGGEQVDGNSWQAYVDSLLHVHFSLLGGVYQSVPDFGGDGGLEGFSTCGHAYQAYADQDSLTPKERTRKQKQKITRDLGKLKKNRVFWESMLQEVKLRRWSLVVPAFEKDVAVHARAKATELKKTGLSFIANDFEAFVETPEAYPVARATLSEPSLVSKSLSPKSVTDENVEELELKEPSFIQNLDYKLSNAAPGVDPKESRRDFLRWHLKCSNFLDELHQKFPMHWETIDQLAAAISAAVQTRQRFDTTPAPERLLQVQAELELRLKNAVSFLREEELLTLSWGHVARWMGECSLFKGATNG